VHSLAKERYIHIGVLLQPYIDLEGGWAMSLVGEKCVQNGRLQVHAAIQASRSLLGGKAPSSRRPQANGQYVVGTSCALYELILPLLA
jgi:hypothetical protein